MKKAILTISAIIIALLIVFAAITILGNPDFFEELPQRLAPYHNSGDITVTLDGEQITLDGISINEWSVYTQSETEKLATVKNNKFKFQEGSYGENIFCFVVPVDVYGDVAVTFGHFNTNWWHEVHYDIQLNLVTNADGSLNADISQTVSYGGVEHFSHSNTEILDETNNLISIYVGP